MGSMMHPSVATFALAPTSPQMQQMQPMGQWAIPEMMEQLPYTMEQPVHHAHGQQMMQQHHPHQFRGHEGREVHHSVEYAHQFHYAAHDQSRGMMANGGSSPSMVMLERDMGFASISGEVPTSSVYCERLYVSSLPKSFSEHELQRMFSPFGQLTEFQIHRRSDGSSKGSACVAFSSAAEGAAACSQLNNFVPQNGSKPIVIKPSTGRRRECRSNSGSEPPAPPPPPPPPPPPVEPSPGNVETPNEASPAAAGDAEGDSDSAPVVDSPTS
ncbi:hypothetical protein AB1Y20_006997 [Prymnesium parvum]